VSMGLGLVWWCALRVLSVKYFFIFHCLSLSYALQSDASKSSPWLTFIGWVSNAGDAYAPICCRGLDHLVKDQGSLLVSAFDDSGSRRNPPANSKVVLRVIPFYHR
jgi:hypothetical protein